MGTLRWLRWGYAAPIARFLTDAPLAILGELAERSDFAVDPTQKQAWLQQVDLLQRMLATRGGHGALYFEYGIPRLANVSKSK